MKKHSLFWLGCILFLWIPKITFASDEAIDQTATNIVSNSTEKFLYDIYNNLIEPIIDNNLLENIDLELYKKQLSFLYNQICEKNLLNRFQHLKHKKKIQDIIKDNIPKSTEISFCRDVMAPIGWGQLITLLPSVLITVIYPFPCFDRDLCFWPRGGPGSNCSYGNCYVTSGVLAGGIHLLSFITTLGIYSGRYLYNKKYQKNIEILNKSSNDQHDNIFIYNEMKEKIIQQVEYAFEYIYSGNEYLLSELKTNGKNTAKELRKKFNQLKKDVKVAEEKLNELISLNSQDSLR